MKQTIPNYPKIEGDRKLYVRYPVLLTSADLHKFPIHVKPGKWVAANVLPGGYEHLVAPCQFDTFDECKKACDATNKLHGFTKVEMADIVEQSMKGGGKEVRPRRKRTMAKP